MWDLTARTAMLLYTDPVGASAATANSVFEGLLFSEETLGGDLDGDLTKWVGKENWSLTLQANRWSPDPHLWATPAPEFGGTKEPVTQSWGFLAHHAMFRVMRNPAGTLNLPLLRPAVQRVQGVEPGGDFGPHSAWFVTEPGAPLSQQF